MANELDERVAREIALLHYRAELDRQRHGVPALLSVFIPGLGQVVKGHVLKGIVVFVGMGLSLAATGTGIGFITTPVLWLWQLYDTYRSND